MIFKISIQRHTLLIIFNFQRFLTGSHFTKDYVRGPFNTTQGKEVPVLIDEVIAFQHTKTFMLEMCRRGQWWSMGVCPACGNKFTKKQYSIKCTKVNCGSWTHLRCINLSYKEALQVKNSYNCVACQIRGDITSKSAMASSAGKSDSAKLDQIVSSLEKLNGIEESLTYISTKLESLRTEVGNVQLDLGQLKKKKQRMHRKRRNLLSKEKLYTAKDVMKIRINI